MTIVEKNGQDSPWLFRTQPLQTGSTPSTREIALELAPPPTSVPFPHQPVIQQKQQQQKQQPPSTEQQQQQQQQRVQQNQIPRTRLPAAPIPIEPKKVVKSSTAPNLPTSNSLSEMFRVI